MKAYFINFPALKISVSTLKSFHSWKDLLLLSIKTLNKSTPSESSSNRFEIKVVGASAIKPD